MTGLKGAGSQPWSQDTASVADSAKAGDRFGSVLAANDLGKSIAADLVVGVPDEDVLAVSDAGMVHVLYGGGPAGVTATASQTWSQNSTAIADASEAGDRFGSALSSGELGNGALGDLAVGVPDENLGAVADAGLVHVIYGATGGLAGAGSQLWTQDSTDVGDAVEAGDHFGFALAASDLGSGAQADLMVGAPNDDVVAVADAGMVHVLYGGAGGVVAAGSQVWSQESPTIADGAEPGDRFGSVLASSDVGKSAENDVVIGVPDENVGAVSDAGIVHVLYGSPVGLAALGSQTWSQNSTLVADTAEAGDAGLAQLLFGGAGGLAAAASQSWTQDSTDIVDSAESGDHFAAALGG